MNKVTILIFATLLLGACTTSPLSTEDSKRAAQVNAQLGLGYIQQGKFEIAKQKLEKAKSYDPDNGDTYHYMAELYRRLNEPELAGNYYREAIDRKPDDSALKNNYAIFQCTQKEYKDANRLFNVVLDDPLYPRKDQVYENMGLCALEQGNLKQAEDNFNKALSYNLNLPVSVLSLAQIDFDKGLTAQAYLFFKRYLKMARHTSQSAWLGYLLEKQRGKHEIAASYAVILKGKFPDSKETALLKKMER